MVASRGRNKPPLGPPQVHPSATPAASWDPTSPSSIFICWVEFRTGQLLGGEEVCFPSARNLNLFSEQTLSPGWSSRTFRDVKPLIPKKGTPPSPQGVANLWSWSSVDITQPIRSATSSPTGRLPRRVAHRPEWQPNPRGWPHESQTIICQKIRETIFPHQFETNNGPR